MGSHRSLNPEPRLVEEIFARTVDEAAGEPVDPPDAVANASDDDLDDFFAPPVDLSFSEFSGQLARPNLFGAAVGSDSGPVPPDRPQFVFTAVVNLGVEQVAPEAASRGGLPVDERSPVVNLALEAHEPGGVRQRALPDVARTLADIVAEQANYRVVNPGRPESFAGDDDGTT